MSEKEIDLNQPIVSEPTSQAKPVQSESHESSETSFNVVKGDLSKKVVDKSSPSEILDVILQAPEEELLPWEEVTLPSRGLYYDGKIPGGVVRIKPMGIYADKILATARLAQSGQSIDYLLENCVQLPDGFNPIELLSGDRTFLLYLLRGVTHGNIYEFVVKCSQCQAPQPCSYDLNELARTITYGNPSIKEPARVDLPYLTTMVGKPMWITVRFLRGSDVSKIANRQRFNKRVVNAAVGNRNNKPTIDETLTENLHLVVTSFMGEVTDPPKIKELISKLHSSDTAEIRQFLREHSPGIDTTITLNCVECNAEMKMELPITESFFRPTKS